ncbi:STAS domain-containing protein [Pseudonocardia sp. TRM90224]|uniref:STAS domain-containing protein n=1 Tax=Pseudonocardia sp. TRM90224 TaxID=2812678 RepID=UPI001E452A35|nr:STAS domain-containing protein [Pseudonocardia sp. TRM90224]
MPDHSDDAFAAQMMRLAVTRSGAAAVITVTGEVDALTAPELSSAVAAAPVATDRLLVLDLTGVTFLGSAGLAVISTAAASVSVPVRVVAATHTVTRPLEVTGLDQVVELHPTLASALTA